MSKKISEEKFFVIDLGILGVPVALALAAAGKEVSLWVPWISAFPKPFLRDIGQGIPGIKRVDDYEDTKAEMLKDKGIFVFPDVGCGGMQKELRGMGGRVFGAGESGELEFNRGLFKEILKERGLLTPQHDFVVGVDDLMKLLQKEKDLWIKLNVEDRGILETCHHDIWEKSEGWFYKLAHDLKHARSTTKFMWERPWLGVETGKDNFVVNGQSFKECLYGWELKGDAYVCRRMDTDKLPAPLKQIDVAMAPVEKRYKTSGAVSSEIRVGPKGAYYLDPCRRFGNPPCGSITANVKNFAEVVRGIADGVEIPIDWRSEYAAELSVEVSGADKEDVTMDISEKDLDLIKLRCACKIGDIYKNIPFEEVGCTVVKAVGLGESREEAEFNAIETAEKFTSKCKGAFFNKTAFEELEAEIEKGRKYGLDPDKF